MRDSLKGRQDCRIRSQKVEQDAGTVAQVAMQLVQLAQQLGVGIVGVQRMLVAADGLLFFDSYLRLRWTRCKSQ